ncbi:MAG: hypothetical protein EXX96DRAFT_327994 [Benjaminiella poitrasii]|nr:MAG: hypothetical protein EXX96DRAFT_327994 [Benjaminiella poitrasii]
MFGRDLVKLKGHRSGIACKLFAALKKREAEGQLIVVTIDEFKTSITYSLCFFDDMTVINTSKFKGFSVLHYKQCRKVWQRDIIATNNMMTIWSGEGRPKVFKPKKKVSP